MLCHSSVLQWPQRCQWISHQVPHRVYQSCLGEASECDLVISWVELYSHCMWFLRLKDKPDFTERRGLALGLLTEQGSALTQALVNACVFCLPSYMMTDSAEVLHELILLDKPVSHCHMQGFGFTIAMPLSEAFCCSCLDDLGLCFSQNASIWLENALKALPSHNSGGAVTATQEQLTAFHKTVTQSVLLPMISSLGPQILFYVFFLYYRAEDLKQVSRAMREFTRLYRWNHWWTVGFPKIFIWIFSSLSNAWLPMHSVILMLIGLLFIG